jgi:hypothetical protein
MSNTEEKPEKKFRNLKKDEKQETIKAFIAILKNIEINNKPFIVNSTTKSITTNPQITIEEIQKTLGIYEDTKMDFVRQLYIRSGTTILRQLFPEEDILNMPVLSFEENGHNIKLSY